MSKSGFSSGVRRPNVLALQFSQELLSCLIPKFNDGNHDGKYKPLPSRNEIVSAYLRVWLSKFIKARELNDLRAIGVGSGRP